MPGEMEVYLLADAANSADDFQIPVNFFKVEVNLFDFRRCPFDLIISGQLYIYRDSSSQGGIGIFPADGNAQIKGRRSFFSFVLLYIKWYAECWSLLCHAIPVLRFVINPFQKKREGHSTALIETK